MSSVVTELKRYPSIDALAREAAGGIAAHLARGIADRGTASLVVSGGRTPVKLFEHLRLQALDWSRVCVALADERWVEPTDAGSNEKLVRDVLLKGPGRRGALLGY